jgi:RNA polymerase sigma-70 factor (ECF subfamily)
MAEPGPPPDSAAEQSPPAPAFWDRAESVRPYLKQVAARLLGAPLSTKLDPSDIVQRAFLSAHQQAPQFRGQTFAEWLGWLVVIVRNESLHALRFYRQGVRDVRREQPLPPGPEAGPPPAASPPEQAQRREQAAAALAALERLPDDYRRVLDLRAFQDLPHAAVAEQLGRSEEAVRQLWVRAVRRLRQELGEQP